MKLIKKNESSLELQKKKERSKEKKNHMKDINFKFNFIKKQRLIFN